MTRCYAITNQKGGVGKTTTAVNLAASLAAQGQRVLLVDMDPQGNASTGSGVRDPQATLYDWLVDDAAPQDVLQRPAQAGFAVIPADGDLTAAAVQLMDHPDREYRLRNRLLEIRADYDYVLLDCPPALNMLTLNALVAADGVIIPMQCEYYALEGLSALMETIEQVRGRANPQLAVRGLLRTMYDPRNALTKDVSRQLIGHFGDAVYRTVIPRNIRLAESPSHGLPVLQYDRQSRGAVAYQALAAEVLRRDADAAATDRGTGA